MSEPSSTTVARTTKVRRDLTECNRALSAWYADSSLQTTQEGEILRIALEALMRAVSTLVLAVEEMQA